MIRICDLTGESCEMLYCIPECRQQIEELIAYEEARDIRRDKLESTKACLTIVCVGGKAQRAYPTTAENVCLADKNSGEKHE